jgi:GTP-binding nuclear protein Ran
MSSSVSSSPKRFKVVLMGDGGVGKTALIKLHKTGEFERKYIATMGVEVNALRFNTTAGDVILNIWDTAGQEKFGGLREGYYLNADAGLLMFDTTAKCTYRSIPDYYSSFVDINKTDVPIVMCGNKVDCKDRVVKPDDIRFHRKVNIQYYDISVKQKFKTEYVFLYLIRKLLKDNTIELTEKEEEKNNDEEELAVKE